MQDSSPGVRRRAPGNATILFNATIHGHLPKEGFIRLENMTSSTTPLYTALKADLYHARTNIREDALPGVDADACSDNQHYQEEHRDLPTRPEVLHDDRHKRASLRKTGSSTIFPTRIAIPMPALTRGLWGCQLEVKVFLPLWIQADISLFSNQRLASRCRKSKQSQRSNPKAWTPVFKRSSHLLLNGRISWSL